eukprot:TRINITY_DN7463_c0_g1_i2.p3 TRINITY_DN7463_c0_g1~~TRINITY_DN7463_c0_g1_i2.p3  ORF type:complete len:108 (+),score=8.27 TRINITY_DN7463_c0_g1_i2:613-936(+)
MTELPPWAVSFPAEQDTFISPVLVQAFILTFLAEWGDRSQIATIILGAQEDPLGVTLGAILGHSICSFIAVMGGRLLAQRISIRTGWTCASRPRSHTLLRLVLCLAC